MYDTVPDILENGAEYYPRLIAALTMSMKMTCILSETIMERRANEI